MLPKWYFNGTATSVEWRWSGLPYPPRRQTEQYGQMLQQSMPHFSCCYPTPLLSLRWVSPSSTLQQSGLECPQPLPEWTADVSEFDLRWKHIKKDKLIHKYVMTNIWTFTCNISIEIHLVCSLCTRSKLNWNSSWTF